MAKKSVVYENFNEYAANDKKYLMRVLKGELNKAQRKIIFADGSNYSVTRAGNRWWGKYGFIHREGSPACQLHWGREGYYLYSEEYTKEEYEEEMKIFHLRPKLEFEFVDVNLMIVQTKDYKWVNPYISNWYKPEEGQLHDNNIYRIYYKNSHNEMLYVYFKSDYLDRKVEAFYNQPDCWTNKKYDLFKPPYMDCRELYESVDMTMFEDVWGPYPPAGSPMENDTLEYKQWIKDSETNQFCFSVVGEKVKEFFAKEAEVDFFSPDCGLTTDGTDWWCDS